jgi:hypothetical protein
MRVNRWILLVSVVLGMVGAWFAWDAATTYVSAARAYASVSVVYERDSFIWLDEDYSAAEAEITIHNRSDSDVIIPTLQLYLYVDGQFAGARYSRWPVISIPKGESITLVQEFSVATASVQDRGGTAQLSLGGQISIEFTDVKTPMTFRMQHPIGQVSKVRN